MEKTSGKYICKSSYSNRPTEERIIGNYNCQYYNSNKLLELWNTREDIRQMFKHKYNWLTYCANNGLIA